MVSPNVGPRKEGKLLYPDYHLIRCMNSGFRPAHFSRLSFCPQGVCIQRGLHPGGVCIQGGLHPGGSASREGLHPRGSASREGLHPVGLGRPPTGYYGIWSTSRQYASYWNAYLSIKTVFTWSVLKVSVNAPNTFAAQTRKH